MKKTLEGERLWTLDDLEVYFSFSRRQVGYLRAREGFPQPIRALGGDSYPRFEPSEVRAWAREQREPSPS